MPIPTSIGIYLFSDSEILYIGYETNQDIRAL